MSSRPRSVCVCVCGRARAINGKPEKHPKCPTVHITYCRQASFSRFEKRPITVLEASYAAKSVLSSIPGGDGILSSDAFVEIVEHAVGSLGPDPKNTATVRVAWVNAQFASFSRLILLWLPG